MALRHERLTDLPELATALTHIARHLALGDLRAVLGDQPLPHPPRRVPLLARRIAIALKPLVDQRPERTELRRRPLTGERLDGGTGDASACLTARR
jgi:hypothetical protein